MQCVEGYGESSGGLASASSDVIKKKKKKRNRKRKRNCSRLSRDSGEESEESQAEKVCYSRASMSPEEEREEDMAVDLAPLGLGVRFEAEMDTLNKEENEVVSP